MANSEQPLGVGVIGCGVVAQQRHLPQLSQRSDARLVAIAEADPARRRSVAARFAVGQAYATAAELLADPAVAVVAICVPAIAHADIACAALAAGKHVLVEKPLALDLADCERMVAAAARAPGKAMVGFNARHHQNVREAMAWLAAGRLGTVCAVRTVMTSPFDADDGGWRGQWRLGGGVLSELGVHCFDLWRGLLGEEVVEVMAVTQSGRWEDEVATVQARLASGSVATALLGKGLGTHYVTELYGDRGQLTLDHYRVDGLHFSAVDAYAGAPGARLRQGAADVARLVRGWSVLRRGGAFVDSYRAEWDHFLACIREDRTPTASFADGRAATQVMLAAVAAARRGQRVRVADAPRTLAECETAPGMGG